MAKTNIIVGLDVGTSKIRTMVASFKEVQKKPRVIGVGEALSNGMRKGVVIDIEEVTESIKKSVEQAELNSGIPIQHAYVSIGGNHISIRANKGLVAVSRADQEISEEDISRVIDSASALSLPLNREILHVIPREFKVDDEGGIQDPLGMIGARLEVDALIIDGLTPCIKNLTKCVSSLGIKINGLVLDVLAASQSVLSKRQKELGVLVLDLGGGT
ncbi:MAG: cell division protein FtsA, partial [Candidatus Omnitrophica bacterium]|nr:cell division protein FtsA [Candidatus Omnitrophota bacterium]